MTGAVVPLSRCGICSTIPAHCGADAIANEGNIPPGARALVGWPDDFSRSRRCRVRCATCETRYALVVETGCMELDIGLYRLTPLEAREELGAERYTAIVRALPRELRSAVAVAREHAARSLAEHYLVTRDPGKLRRLLVHPRADVRAAAWKVCSIRRAGLDVDACEDVLLALLRSRVPALRRRVLRCLRDRTGLRLRAAELVAKLGASPLSADGLVLLEAIVEAAGQIDLDPVRDGLRRAKGRRGLAQAARRRAAKLLRIPPRARASKPAKPPPLDWWPPR